MTQIDSKLRILQVTCAIVWCLFAAGPIFGFAALKPILIAEGVYHNVCKVGIGMINKDQAEDALLCVAQDLKLNKMFTVAAVVTNAAALLVGYVLDSYGPRVCGFIGSALIFIGALLLSGFFTFVSFIDPYLTGYIFLALGGPFVFISSFQLANSFPKHSGMILALLTGAFDSSSAVFLIYRLIYQNFERVPLVKFFTLFLIVPIFIFLCQLFIMPNQSYKTIGTVQKLAIEGLDENGQLLEGDDGSRLIPDINERTSLLSFVDEEHQLERTTSLTATGERRKSIYEEYAEHELINKSGNIFGILDGHSAMNQIKSPFFYIMCGFTAIQMIKINYFVATIRSQEEYLIGFKLASKINNIFDIALPLGGIVAIPIIGILLDNVKTVNILAILLTVSSVIGVCGLFHSFIVNLIGVLLLVVYRPFYYTAVSDYTAKVFGFTTFGTVYGLMICISGLLNYFQVYLDYATKNYYKNDPFPVNLLLITLTVFFGSWLIIYILSQQRHINRRRLENEAERAPVTEIPH